jgi:hypothetical protein
MAGQRIFNEAAGRAAVTLEPGEIVVTFLKRLMGDGAPKRAEVLTATKGLDEDYLNDVCQKVEAEWERKRGTSYALRITPWTLVQNHLNSRTRMIRR